MIFISFETIYILKNRQSQYKKKMIDSLRRSYARRALHFFLCGDVTKNSPRILHEFARIFRLVEIDLKLIFDHMLATGIYPNTWKLANLTPIHKKGDKQFVNNYCSMSLLPICGKLFEHIAANQLYVYFTTNII